MTKSHSSRVFELGFGESGLTVGAWGSWFVQDRERTKGVDEIDLYADFSTMLTEESGVGISIGFYRIRVSQWRCRRKAHRRGLCGDFSG